MSSSNQEMGEEQKLSQYNMSKDTGDQGAHEYAVLKAYSGEVIKGSVVERLL